MEIVSEEKRLKQHFSEPLQEEEKCSGRHLTKEAAQAFFNPAVPRVFQTAATVTTTTTTTMEMATTYEKSPVMTPKGFCDSVTAKMSNDSFLKEFKDSRAPLPMIAFAGTAMEKIVGRGKNNNLFDYVDGLTITVPDTKEAMTPAYHSIVGQKLLYVDWIKIFGLKVQCPRCPTGTLQNDRTNFSKNKILFPIFDLDGPPSWAMVQSMVCVCCRVRMNANTDAVICQLPAYARNCYPVESKYAIPNKNCHIGRTATAVMDLLMPTYGNGDLCSRLLYNAINRSYLERVDNYYSYYKAAKSSNAVAPAVDPYVEKVAPSLRHILHLVTAYETPMIRPAPIQTIRGFFQIMTGTQGKSRR